MLKIRPLQREDYTSVIKMLNQGRLEGFFAPGPEITPESFNEYATSRCYENYTMVVADLDGRVSGFLDYYTFGGVGNILGIFVVPERRNEHIGTNLVETSTNAFLKLGCHMVRATVYAYNKTALEFLKANGFRKRALFRNDEFHRDLVYMHRVLCP